MPLKAMQGEKAEDTRTVPDASVGMFQDLPIALGREPAPLGAIKNLAPLDFP